jgi:hypothetical protein
MTGFNSKQRMAADKFIAVEERKVGERYGYVPKLHPSEYMGEPVQEPSATRPCRSCGGTGERWTGIDESPTSICKPCNGTGQIALTQPAQEPVARVTGVYGGRFTYEPLNPAMVLPVGMALYSAPPAQEKNL